MSICTQYRGFHAKPTCFAILKQQKEVLWSGTNNGAGVLMSACSYCSNDVAVIIRLYRVVQTIVFKYNSFLNK